MSIIPRFLPGWFVLFGLLLMLAPPAAAATSGNQAEPASRVSPAAFAQTIRLPFASASDRFFYLVATDGMSIGVAVADCCIAGDTWGAILLAPGRQIALAHNSDPDRPPTWGLRPDAVRARQPGAGDGPLSQRNRPVSGRHGRRVSDPGWQHAHHPAAEPADGSDRCPRLRPVARHSVPERVIAPRGNHGWRQSD